MPPDPNWLSRFWQELKRRRVIHVIIVYATAAFVIIELINNITDPLNLPEWTPTLVIIILLVGFPLAIIFSWIFDVTPGGIEKTKASEELKPDEKAIVPNFWKIATFVSFIIILGLLAFNLFGGRVRGKAEIRDKSVAVLPFINDSQELENEHFINGIMEELLINLQSIKELRVPGRTSTEQYRNNPKPIPEIAAEMNVAYIVEGSGQRYGNKIRLRIQLVEGATDKHIWADSYDEQITTPEDIFRIQSQIAKSIAEELQAVITPQENSIIEKIPTTSLTAHDYFQRGREEHWNYMFNRGSLSLDLAKNLYQEALKYDSSYAQAYTGLAWVYLNRHYAGTFLAEDFLDSVLIYSDIALSHDEQLSEAYAFRGYYFYETGQSELAIREFDKAIQLNPNDWMAYRIKGYAFNRKDLSIMISCYHKAASLNRGEQLPGLLCSLGWAYGLAGFRDLSIKHYEEAYRLDRNEFLWCFNSYNLEATNGNYQQAAEWMQKCFSMDSTNHNVITQLVYMNVMAEEYEKALNYFQWFKENYEFEGLLSLFAIHRIGLAYWKNGYREEGGNYFNEQIKTSHKIRDLGRGEGDTIRIAYDLAATYAFLGEKEKSLEYLRIYDKSDFATLYGLNLIRNDPLFHSIRDEPEFQQIIRNVEAQFQAQHERVRQWLEENDML